jgi:hypothetical protein
MFAERFGVVRAPQRIFHTHDVTSIIRVHPALGVDEKSVEFPWKQTEQ